MSNSNSDDAFGRYLMMLTGLQPAAPPDDEPGDEADDEPEAEQ